jgi:hypothetical protein
LALIVGVCGAIGGLAYWATVEHEAMLDRQPSSEELSKIYGSGTAIRGGVEANESKPVSIEISNPEQFKDMECRTLNYISQGNKIYAVNTATGKKTPIVFKGVNWRGMEGWDHVITGLWNGPRDGNSFVSLVARYIYAISHINIQEINPTLIDIDTIL